MAKQNPTGSQVSLEKQATNLQRNTGSKEAPEPSKDSAILMQVLERLEKVEKENQELKENGTINTKTNSREKYSGPLWSFRYKIYNGKAIVKVETTAMQTVKNNVTNKYINQHEVLLTFADGETEKVDYDLYTQLLEWSPGIDLHEINDVEMRTLEYTNKGVKQTMKNHKFWTFRDTPHGTFEVPELYIN